MNDTLRKTVFIGAGAFLGYKAGLHIAKNKAKYAPGKNDKTFGNFFLLLAIIGIISMFWCLILGLVHP